MSNLFQYLADGPRIQTVYEQLQVADAQRIPALSNKEIRDKRTATLNSPSFHEWLPKMGYESFEDWRTPGEIAGWRLKSFGGADFFRSCDTCVQTRVITPENALDVWSAVIQEINPDQIELALRHLTNDFDIATMVAWAVHKAATTSIDFPWVIEDNRAWRHAAPWPVRTPVRGEPRYAIMTDSRKTAVPCHAWVIDQPVGTASSNDKNATVGEVIFLSVAGSAALMKMAKANWANRSNRTMTHWLPKHDASQVKGAANANARWFSMSMPEGIHGVYVDERILRPTHPHFYHIAGPDGTPDWTLLYDQLNKTLMIPIAYDDIQTLWNAAYTNEDIVGILESYGCQGYKIRVDCLHQWAAIIGYATGKDVSVEFVGHTQPSGDEPQELIEF